MDMTRRDALAWTAAGIALATQPAMAIQPDPSSALDGLVRSFMRAFKYRVPR